MSSLPRTRSQETATFPPRQDDTNVTSESQPNTNDTNTDPQPPKHQTLWHSKNTPIWNEAVEKWKSDSPKQYAELDKLRARFDSSHIDKADEFFRLASSKPSSNQATARTKRWLPVLAAIRGITMTAAALDPHKIAPIVCASVFFSIDVNVSISVRNLATLSRSC